MSLLKIELTDEQEALVQDAVAWFRNPDAPQVYEYSAQAGCGKSLVMHFIIERLGLLETEVAPCTLSGAAALVMRRNGFRFAKTIHSTIYAFQSEWDKEEKVMKRKFDFVGVPDEVKLLCIDESSMVGANLRKDLERCGIKIIACGDINQLPPVKDSPAFLTDPMKVRRLTKIMRQTEGSAIVQLSKLLLKGIPLQPGNYGQVQVIFRSDLQHHLRDYVREYGILLCGTNRSRDELNKIIREEIYGYDSPLPLKGEKLICRKNNWEIEVDGINLVNGLYGTAMSSPSISSFQGPCFKLDFKPDFMDQTFEGLEVDYKYFRANHDLRTLMRQQMENQVFEKFEYAYAITTHVSQGSQFDSGIYVQEYFPSHSNNLNYTGLTRFRERALYVIPDRRKYWRGRSSPFKCKFLIPVPKVDGTIS